MPGTFLLPFRHLSLDHTRIDSVPPRVGTLQLHLPEQAAIPLRERLRTRAVTFRQPALEDLEAPQERQPIGVQPGRRRRLEHQRPDHEMAQRQRINLLDHPRTRLAPQLRRLGRPPRVLVGLLLVEDQLRLPTIMPPKRGACIGPPRAATPPPAEGRRCSGLTRCHGLWAWSTARKHLLI